jgi:hypothetical protein
MRAAQVFGFVVAILVSAWASFSFFKGSLTGSPPLYSHGWSQRILHFVAGVLFAAMALFASLKLCSRLYVASPGSLTREGVAVVNPQHSFTAYPPSVYLQFFQACSPDQPCTRSDNFRVDPLPKGCCTLLLTNGDGRGNDEVQNYKVFLNGKSVLASDQSPNGEATVNVQTSNKIEVVLTGKPTAKVFVLLAYDPRTSK